MRVYTRLIIHLAVRIKRTTSYYIIIIICPFASKKIIIKYNINIIKMRITRISVGTLLHPSC